MKNSSIRIISFMAIAIAINYIGANIALFLRLPIYLDMIGTLLVAVVFGPWLGAGAAIVSALISWMTTDIFAIYFAPVAIVAAFIAGFLVKETSKSKDLIWKSLLVSLPGTVVSSSITVILFHGITSSGSGILAQILHSLGIDMTASLVLVQAITDYADRLISLALVLVIIKSLKTFAPNLMTAKN
ncbi:LytS/YhcK type 5TM receptor domain-containing protein [uncultured Streptococcus sp.]|uniref:LytS/YhcK type 5TM receptor domain-containing protein n=1 Tax=uncultured Streptococcus sp. TaxID=83427 RepID=UPI00259ABEA7|nr:LytS/YhcK type 5TM receptor domain-containing protein [uncultured Streptococcus sp.]